MTSARNNKFLLAAIFVTVGAQFVWDMIAPNGLADWVWYFIPIYLSIYVGGRLFSYLLASLISLLILIGYYCSAQGIDPQLALIGRLMGIAVIWLMCVIIAHYKLAEEQRRKIERALRMTSECNQQLVRAEAEDEYLQNICQSIVEVGGYRMSWVGFARDDAQKSVEVAAYAGCEEGYLEKAKITWSDQGERGGGPTGLAIRHGEMVVCNDFQNDERTAPWWAEGRKRRYLSSVTIPLIQKSENFGVLVLYAGVRNAFSSEELSLLKELADDLAYGICSLRAGTAKKLAEAASHSDRARLQFLLRHTPAIIYSLRATPSDATPKLEVSFISPNVETILGHPPEKFTQNAGFWFECLYPEDAVKPGIAGFNPVASGIVSREYRFRHANGSYRWMRDEMRLVHTHDGQPDEFVGHWFDITEQKRAEELRRKSQTQFETLFVRHQACKLVIDPVTGVIRNANEAAVKFYGWPLERMRQLRVHDLSTMAAVEVEKRLVDMVKHGGGRFESRHRLADGVERDVEVFSTAIETDGEMLLYSINIDITNRKAAERMLRSEQATLRGILNATLESVWLFDVDCRILTANEIAARRYGKTINEIVGKHYSELVSPDLAQSRIAWLKKAMRLNQPLEVEDERDGKLYRSSLYPVSEPVGEVTGLVCYSRDITEQRQVHAALLKREEIYSSIVNQAGDAIGLVDVETMRFVEFNEAAHVMLGYTREEFTGFGPANIEGKLTPEEIREKFKLIVEHGKAIFETQHRHRNAELRDVRVNARLIRLQGKDYITSIWSDITEARRKEAQLRKLSLAVEQNPASIVITDPQGNIEYANQRFTEVTGYTLEEVRGQNPRILKSGQQATAVYEELWREITAGRDWRGELVNRKKDGSFHTELVVIAPVKNEAHVITHFVAMKEDITAARKAAAELETQRRFLADLVENSILQIFVKDREGRYLMVNRSFETTSNRRRAQTLGRTDVEVFGEVDGQRFREHDLAVMRSGQNQVLEEKLSGENGHERTFISTKFPVRNESEAITGIAAMILEITDRIQAETQAMRLATAVEQSAETIVITDTEGTILYANPAFEKSTGYTRAEAIGKNPRLLKSGKQDAWFYREMWDRLARGETWKGHFVNQRKDGTLYEEDATISPVRDEHGKIVSYVAAKRDVTREVQLEAQFRQAQKMEAMGTLAGGIAHDFNNILTVIFGYGSLLQFVTKKDQEVYKMVEEILRAANRAKELVQQILTFSRRREQKREFIRLVPVIKEATKFLRASLPANVQIDMELAENAPAVLADPTQIYQVVMNLATNALHAMEGQQGRLTVKLEAFTPDEMFLATHSKLRPIPYTRLTIADTGHGMDARTMERIFEPFFTTKPVGKGTGLGLAVVLGIIQSHDGAITVDSQIGRGTTFSLFFPAQTADRVVAEAAADQLPLGNGQKIMVVDDEAAVAVMVQELLKTLNYQATVCNRPSEAIALIQKYPDRYELVITDLTMPEMNGLDLARQVRARCPDVPIILVSGFATTLTESDLKEVGICQLLPKPVAMTDLAKALQQRLSS